MHYIIWPINIILQIIPFFFNAYYGLDEDQKGLQPISRCLIGSDSEMLSLYLAFFTADIELLISFIMIAILTIIIVVYTYNVMRQDPLNTTLTIYMKDTLYTVIWYPIALLIAYMPLICFEVYSFMYSYSHYANSKFQVVFNVLANSVALYGLFLSLIFYIKTKDARNEWCKILNSLRGYIDKDFDSLGAKNPIILNSKRDSIPEEYL
jgi:hypothetical protein